MLALQSNHLFKTQNYLNGKWVEAPDGAHFPVFNPWDQTQVGVVPKMGAAQAEAAIQAAQVAFLSWKQKPAKERCALIRRWAELIEKHREDLARILTLEQGKPLSESLSEIQYGNDFNFWYAEEGLRIDGEVLTSPVDRRLLVLKQPIGVCTAITPWNFPHAMIPRKAAPALVAGCTIVVKPAEATPYSALALAVLAEEAGIPPGVFNVITGDPAEIGFVFSTHPSVKKLSFTGSTRIGKLLMRQSSETVKKLSLELGGNAPFIVFSDASIQEAVSGLLDAKFRNAGQACVAANRVYVQDSLYPAIIAPLLEAMKGLKVGNGLEADTCIGPLINEAAIQKVERLVADAQEKGARLLCGGARLEVGSLCYLPTLLVDVPASAQLNQEEIFGPVLALQSFTEEAEVVRLANATSYGLAAYCYTNDLSRAWRMAESLEYGMVSLNKGLFSTASAPFGGIKESGFGREGSKHGLEDYLTLRYVCMGMT